MNPHDHPKWDQWSAQGLSESEMRDLIAAEELAVDLSGVRASMANEGYNPQEHFFGTIIRKAHQDVVTAEDFRPFIDCNNWLLMDGEDCPNGLSGICGFTVFGIRGNLNSVDIVVDFGPTHMAVLHRIPADELAIRMDAS